MQSADLNERLLFAARLADKAWMQGCRVLIRTGDADSAGALDALLWQIKPESFIPHSRDRAAADPVLICRDTSDPPHRELVINLADGAPERFETFQRLAEIVVQAPQVLAATRRQFSLYRERGYSVNTHKL